MGGLNNEEAKIAAWEATRGAVTGAARWGIYSGLLGAAAYAYSPVYRGLTLQFKVFLQMSGMIAGGMIEADRRFIDYESQVRLRKRQRFEMARRKELNELREEQESRQSVSDSREK